MKCYYEVLEVDRDADDDEIKKSYKKLALKWHPDKNLDDAEGAKMKFQTIQQAYEVLSDPRERSWYDNHRDSILKGGFDSDYKDDSLDVYRYFTSNCYSGYGDDPKSFYSVYAEVFKTIAAEDATFDDDNSDTDVDVPQFGDSTSSYDDVVGPFYAHWESYSTKKTFSWLDQFDIRQAPDRRVVKMMERENKKIRDAARKQRNDEVRNLVAFVRKRDKRIQIRIRQLELKAEENELKNRRQRNEQILRRKAEIDSTVESEWSKFSNFEDKLKEIEADVDSKFDDGAEENDPLYCVACDKLFKTVKTFTNHESSKKHKENLLLIAESMMNDDEAANDETLDLSGLSLEDDPIVESTFQKKNKKHKKRTTKVDVLTDDENVDLSGLSLEDDPPIVEPTVKKKNKKEKKRLKKGDASTIDDVTNDSPDDDSEPESTKKDQKRTNEVDELTTDDDLSAHSPDDESWVKKKNKKEKKRTKTVDNVDETTTREDDVVDAPRRRRRRKEKTKDDKPPVEVENDDAKSVVEIKCSSCEETFKSKNALFKHLRSTGHAAILTTNDDRVPKKKNKSGKR